MIKRMRKGLLAFLLVIALVCGTAGFSVMFARPALAEGSVSRWDGDLIKAGWGDVKAEVPAGYEVTEIPFDDENVNGDTGLTVLDIKIGSADAFAYFAHEVYKDRVSYEKAQEADAKEELAKAAQAEADAKQAEAEAAQAEADAKEELAKADPEDTAKADEAKAAKEVATKAKEDAKLAQAEADAKAKEANEATAQATHKMDGAYVTLTVDIDLQNHLWIPIGQTGISEFPEVRFSGYFYGDGHVISNLNSQKYFESLKHDSENGYYIDYNGKNLAVPSISEESYAYGLFGVVNDIEVWDLTVKGVNLSVSESDPVQVASLGAVIGYSTGSVTMGNCVAGSSENADIIKAESVSGSIGGLVGAIASCGNSAKVYNDYGDISISNCINYVNLENDSSDVYLGGIVGAVQFFKTCVITDSTNHGDIVGGNIVGGITSGWTNPNEYRLTLDEEDEAIVPEAPGEEVDEEISPSYSLEILYCNNYGNIEYGTDSGSDRVSGGIVGQLSGDDDNSKEGYCEISIVVDSCNNFGYISGNGGYLGGVIGQYCNTAGITAKIIDNFNLGKIYSSNGTVTGGYIGQIEVNRGDVDLAGVLTISGANLGKMYHDGNAQNIGGIFGENSLNFSDEDGDRLTELYYVDAGTVEEKGDGEISKKHLIFEIERKVDETTDDGLFKYADPDCTILTGFADDASVPETLVIPATVRTISPLAFIGQSKITKVIFNNNLTQIGDFAFAGVSLTEIDLPSSLEVIGTGAFADLKSVEVEVKQEDSEQTQKVEKWLIQFTLPASVKEIGRLAFANCENLNYVLLSRNAEKIKFGSEAFRGTRVDNGSALGAYLIATGNDQYRQAVANGNTEVSLGILTHEVTVNYIYDGKTVYTEKKLRNQDYKVSFDEKTGKWGSADLSYVGPQAPEGINYVWYDSVERDNKVSKIEDVTAFLASVRADSFTLYAFVTAGGNVFIARTDLKYEAGQSFSGEDLNSLLYSSSDLIDFDTMNVTIKYNGKTVNSIDNAGEYKIVIEAKDKSYNCEFTVIIARTTLDLTDIANLEWLYTENSVTTSSLVSDTLYIYTYSSKAGEKVGQEFPSLKLLTDAQINYLKLNNSYTTREVRYSILYNRGKDVTIKIFGEGYSVEYIKTEAGDDTNVGNEAGRYKTKAVITSDGNYELILGNNGLHSYSDTLRGLKIVIDPTTNTATVEKDWYIVDLSNKLVSGSADFALSGHVFGNGGNTLAIAKPESYYKGEGGAITLSLFLDGKQIGASFGVTQIDQYINRVMPAGVYTLVIDVEAVTETSGVYHNGFTENITFTVAKASLPSLDRVKGALNGKTFTYDVNDARLYDENAENAIGALLNWTSANRQGVWIDSKYDNYYGRLTITYNLARQSNEEYSSSVNTSKADTYTVYYKISAPNYISSIENLVNETRYNYYFTLVRYEMLAVPSVVDDGLYYTGTRLLPAIEESDLYQIIWDDKQDYSLGGAHTVCFELYDKEHYRWKDKDGNLLTDKDGSVLFTVPVGFEVKQADNSFTVSLNLLGWSYGSFDAQINNIRAIAKFLDAGKEIYFSVTKEDGTALGGKLDKFTLAKDEKGEVTSHVDDEIAKLLNSLSTGKYSLHATIEGTANYKEFSDFTDFEISKAINNWKDGAEDLVLPSWIVGKYNAENNPIVVNAEYGTVNIIVKDINDNEFYNSVTGLNKLNDCKVGKYLLVAWVDETDNYAALAQRSFTIQVFEKMGLPWWVTLLIVVGALAVVAIVVFILWKKGVFQVVTDKIMLSIRTRVSVEATIASVRAAKMMEEGRKSVEEANKRERLEKLRQKAKEQREMSVEERAALLEAKAQADAERAEKLRARSESAQAKADKMRSQETSSDAPKSDTPKDNKE